MSTVEQAEERGGIIAYRASAELIAEIEAAAAAEGITRSDVARCAVMRDLTRSGTARSPYPHIAPQPRNASVSSQGQHEPMTKQSLSQYKSTANQSPLRRT